MLADERSLDLFHNIGALSPTMQFPSGGGGQTDIGAVGLPMGNYWLTNFRTGLSVNAWDAELFVTNLTNRRAVLYVNQFGDQRPMPLHATLADC